MAIKITKQITTDKGDTSEAYVRISIYTINKYGNASFSIEIFQNEADSKLETLVNNVQQHLVKNAEIGENLYILLNKNVDSNLVPDLLSVKGIDIFQYGYSKLKEKLVELYSVENVIDC
jgi:hypothetical protein